MNVYERSSVLINLHFYSNKYLMVSNTYVMNVHFHMWICINIHECVLICMYVQIANLNEKDNHALFIDVYVLSLKKIWSLCINFNRKMCTSKNFKKLNFLIYRFLFSWFLGWLSFHQKSDQVYKKVPKSQFLLHMMC